MKCSLCSNRASLLHETYDSGMRVCNDCRSKLVTHIAGICEGCDQLYWIPKLPEIVAWAAKESGLFMDYILDNFIFIRRQYCRRCAHKSELVNLTHEVRYH